MGVGLCGLAEMSPHSTSAGRSQKLLTPSLRGVSMEIINDSEFLASPEALASFRHSIDTKIRPLGRTFWEKLDFTEDKTTDELSFSSNYASSSVLLLILSNLRL